MTVEKPTTIAVIPARMGSSRFPGKPLASILGISMIEHVYRRTAMCRSLDAVYVATCDREIHEAVESFGGNAIMTSALHTRASDRVAEAVASLRADIVVMVQGDEPMIHPEMIRESIAPMLRDSDIKCVNLAKRIKSPEEYSDPNTIKAVMDLHGDALYFSREPIPTDRVLGFEQIAVYKQVCIIPFRREVLLEYAGLEPTPLEKAESVDMMRLLEHGFKVHLVETDYDTHAVDTPEDLKSVEERMQLDPVTREYLERSK